MNKSLSHSLHSNNSSSSSYTEDAQKFLLVFRHIGLITSCPMWVLVFHEKIGNLTNDWFWTTRLPSEHMDLLVVTFSFSVFSLSLTFKALLCFNSWLLYRPSDSSILWSTVIDLDCFSAVTLEEYVPLSIEMQNVFVPPLSPWAYGGIVVFFHS